MSKAVAGLPGYGGHVPTCLQPLLATSTNVTKRVNVTERHEPSQPHLSTDVTKTVPEPFGELPPHETYLLPKRALGAQSIYTTDAPPPVKEFARPFTKTSPAPQNRGDLPEHRPFNDETTSRSMGENFVESATDRRFYSSLITDRAPAEDTLHRLQEGREISAKGHKATPGLLTLRHTPEMDAAGLPNLSKPVFKNPPCRPLAAVELPAAADLCKFTGYATQATSYALEYGTRGDNPRDKYPKAPMGFVAGASTKDLFRGTVKDVVPTGTAIPGYMGHVPANPSNVAKIRGDADPLRNHSKETIRMQSRNELPGYGGFSPKSCYNDLGRSLEPTKGALTTSGRAAQQVIEGEVEQALNSRDFAKPHATKHFFTRGGGEDNSLIADLYFSKFRPMEGRMKHGSTTDQRWINENQLKRSHVATGSA
eukprot:TRINITY_DN6662_c0_g1_i1.p1 TRINITY_DN6662_c0_g1~~TRINITY_DN6662_c0_g1_i1.p1  ORF type:complete len:424 (+),score=37.76 TRINITY_DN6662_c0_g1_i1:51-1322(+)